ncbi:ead/Ea22-like family protein [Citrobacter amalonaticus]|uniref:ead/Ea22-like family protein n=1 Tax=Citrobacter amalonaticus TaxID=35703 RepID=UPI001788808D|nr:ead/Ea22-like family protein [Citrobacter amalonaticus]
MTIDKQALREIAEQTKIAGEAPVMPFEQRINALNDFMKHFTPATVLALLDELEVRDKQVAELVTDRLNLQWILNVYAHAYEEAKEQIAKDVEIKARLCRESNSLFDRLRAAEKHIAELEAMREVFLRAKALMYQSGGAPIENSLNPIDAWLYDAERAAAGIGKGA